MLRRGDTYLKRNEKIKENVYPDKDQRYKIK